MDKDKRYWKFVNGELIEKTQPRNLFEKNQQELNRSLEREKTDHQELARDLNVMRIEADQVPPLRA